MRGRNAKLIRKYHPSYRPAKEIYLSALESSITPESAWLDVGCGRHVCADRKANEMLPRRARLAVGVDLDPYLVGHTSIRNLVRCDTLALPFPATTFDIVTSSMVLEHMEKPDLLFREVNRVLRPQGQFLVFTPNRFNYGMIVAAVTPHRFHDFYKSFTHYLNRGAWSDLSEDVFPTWYRANSVRRLRALAAEAGFEVKRLEHLAYAHSFGFVRPLYAASLLFERFIARYGLDFLKADILGVFVRPGNRSEHTPELLKSRKKT